MVDFKKYAKVRWYHRILGWYNRRKLEKAQIICLAKERERFKTFAILSAHTVDSFKTNNIISRHHYHLQKNENGRRRCIIHSQSQNQAESHSIYMKQIQGWIGYCYSDEDMRYLEKHLNNESKR